MTAVEMLQQLVRMRTVNPPGDEAGVAKEVSAHLAAAGLETRTLVSPGGRANLVARIDGPRDRPALVLLSHSDVVPVEEDRWQRDPFGAEDVDGVIWGRGALDMKGITVMHAAAAAALAQSTRTPTRELIVAGAAEDPTAIIDLASDLDAAVRATALGALTPRDGEWMSREARAMAVRALHDPAARVRAAAAQIDVNDDGMVDPIIAGRVFDLLKRGGGITLLGDDEDDAEEAKSICALCPVRQACLEFALTTREKHGVWGGLTERERRRVLRRRRKSA